jgi:putative transposase
MGRLTHRTAPGFTYFVTTKVWQNRPLFQVVANAEVLFETLTHYRDQGAYLLHEFVIMPNHIHMLLTPSDTTSLEKVMQLIKGGSSHELHRRRGFKIQLWQSGFHEESVRNETDYMAKVDYIRSNPVRAGLVESCEKWQWSSASVGFPLDNPPSRWVIPTSGAEAP